MKILVTGATGFLGTNLVRSLCNEGHLCRCLVRPDSNLSSLNNLSSIEWFFGDITDPNSLIGIHEGIDAVFHLAATMGHVGTFSATKKQWNDFRGVNIVGTQNLVNCFIAQPLKRFVFLSSTAAMGIIPDVLVNEKTTIQPKTPYQCSKAEAEDLLREYYKYKGLPVIILRASVFSGKGMVGDLYKLIRFIKKGILPHIGWGQNFSPMMHVNDLVDACISTLERGRDGETYIITSSRSYEMRELTNSVKRILKANPFEITIPVPVAMGIAFLCELFYKLARINPMVTMESIRGVSANRKFSITKAQIELGFEPKIGLDLCVSDAVEWLREQKKI